MLVDELETIKKLAQMGISVNCTACMSVSQAIMARVGCKIRKFIWGRIRDGGNDPEKSNYVTTSKKENLEIK